MELGILCLKICVNTDPTHVSAFNNLAVLHQKIGRDDLAKVYSLAVKTFQVDMDESNNNSKIILKK